MIIQASKKHCYLLFFSILFGSCLAEAQDTPTEEPADTPPADTTSADAPPADAPPADAPPADAPPADAPPADAHQADAQPADQPVDPEVVPIPAGDLVIADFESEEFGDWTVDGEAFGPGPVTGGVEGQMEVSGFEGDRLVNSFHGNDATVGTLTSSEFTIERPWINLLIGGGRHPETLRVDLMVEGQRVRSATGNASETLIPFTWDVQDLGGQTASIVLVDNHTGGWGHLLVDHIVQSNDRATAIQVAQQRVLPAIGPNDRYLNIPVKTGASKVRMSLEVDGQVVREFDIELSDNPDLWVFAEMTDFAGKPVKVLVDALADDSKALGMLEVAEDIKNADQLYQETYRPQFHFSTKRGWINDPNGLVYYKGEYHLFFQHNPYGHTWGNMHWGHAVSKDLVHWEQLPIALYPKAYGDWAFSGGALVDTENTSGFKSGTEAPIVAFYTSTGRGECVIYSNDRGRSWTEYEGNPVVKHEGRDPKVIWHERSRQWVMAVYDEFEEGQYIAFYTAPNLKDWTFQSRIEGFYECPELFEMKLNLDPTNTRWVLYGADGDYLLGQFDGNTFTPEGDKIKGNYGNCFYASQMYSNVPFYDGRQIQVGWGKVTIPDMPFNQLMLFPCTLHLKDTVEGPRLQTMPVHEIVGLRGKTITLENESVSDSLALDLAGGLYDLEATFEPGDAKSVGFDIRGVAVTYDVAKGELSCEGQIAPLLSKEGKVTLRVLVDRTTIEIYANGGLVYMPMGMVLDGGNEGVAVTASGGSATVNLRGSELKSIWPKAQTP